MDNSYSYIFNTTCILILTLLIILIIKRRRNYKNNPIESTMYLQQEAKHLPNIPFYLRGGDNILASGLKPINNHPKNARPFLHRSTTRAPRELLIKHLLLTKQHLLSLHYRQQNSTEIHKAGLEVLQLILKQIDNIHVTTKNINFIQNTGTITVKETKETYNLIDYKSKSILLASLLVQEDLLLLQPQLDSTGSIIDHIFVSGCAVFSFTELGLNGERGNMKVGNTLSAIHKNVPYFENKLAQRMNRLFAVGLAKQKYGMSRSTWGIAPHAAMSPYENEVLHEDKTQEKYSYARELKTKMDDDESGDAVKKIFSIDGVAAEKLSLIVEYQTIQKLPLSGFVLFTVHTYRDSLAEIGQEVGLILSKTIRTLSESQLRYKDLGNEKYREKLLSYLENL